MSRVRELPTPEEMAEATKKFENALRAVAGDTKSTASESTPTDVKLASQVDLQPAPSTDKEAVQSEPKTTEVSEALLEARAELSELAKQRSSGVTSEMAQARQELDALARAAKAKGPIAVPKATVPPERLAELQIAKAELANLAAEGSPSTQKQSQASVQGPSAESLLEAKSEMAALVGAKLPKTPQPITELPKMSSPPPASSPADPATTALASAVPPTLPDKEPASIPATAPKAESPPPPKDSATEATETPSGLQFAKEVLDDVGSRFERELAVKESAPERSAANAKEEMPESVGSASPPPLSSQELADSLPQLGDWSPTSPAPSPEPAMPDSPPQPVADMPPVVVEVDPTEQPLETSTKPAAPKVRLLPAQPADVEAVNVADAASTDPPAPLLPQDPPSLESSPSVSLGTPSADPTDELENPKAVSSASVEQSLQRLNSAAKPDQRLRALKDLSNLKKWYAGPGAVDSVMRVASTSVDQPSRVMAVRMLGQVPRSTHKAVALLRGLARSDRDSAIRQAAQNVLLERTAATTPVLTR